MTTETIPAFGEATLTDCDREPVHIPGAIQPHGVLLVLSEPDLRIIQASNTMRRHLELAAERMLGHELSLVVDAAGIALVRAAMADDLVEPRYLLPLTTAVGLRMEAVIHRTEAGLLLELEPFVAETELDIPHLFRRMLSAVHEAPTLALACDAAVRHLRRIIGFDRVMIYRFRADGAGAVIAEDRREDLTPFLGLHYPASDIPVQARRLFTLNPLRVWAGTKGFPGALLPVLNPRTQAPLDMSRCVLRAASPIHLEYLRNMGVGASMALSIIRDGQLWGLIACHHATRRQVPHAQRVVCESLGHLLGLQIEAKERDARSAEMVRLHAWIAQALQSLGAGALPADALHALGGKLLDFIPAVGVAVHMGGRVTTCGVTPSAAHIAGLAQQLATHAKDDVLASHRLEDEFGEVLATDGSRLCGMLALPASRVATDVVLWFRPELVQTVRWAGDPSKAVGVEPANGRLTPRASFAAWAETVGGTAEPWSVEQVEGAQTFRRAVLEFAPRQPEAPAAADLAAAQMRQTLLTKEGELRVTEALAAARGVSEHMRQLVVSLERLAEALQRA